MADEPHVTRDELRDALRVTPPRRRSTLLDWGADLSEADRDELEKLRDERAATEAEHERLRGEVARHEAGERALRGSLRELAGAGLFERRKVLARLREQGVL